MLHRILHKSLCDYVHDRISVADDRVKLSVESVLNYLRHILAVHLSRGLIALLLKLLIGILNDRRTLIRSYRSNTLTHIGDHIRSVYDYSLRSLPA